ncbi:MAG: hypothetical protein LBN04_08685 [Oscillospiraceae bacterium]|jgi:hypothetical protein|nr:hypothetical protein [Oscillospiraceae bacterium]
MAILPTAVNLLALLLLIAGAIVLQVFLSKQTSWFPGLILPIITFAFSLLALLSWLAPEDSTWVQTLLGLLSTFFLSNIPTLVLLGIYFAVRGKRKENKDMEKMRKHDLE